MRPMRLLLLNPNTSVHITGRLAASARAALGPADALSALTAAEGPAVIASREQAEAAAATVLAMARAHADGHDAVVLGVSLDCGLAATRAALAPRALPVIGMTEAACLVACTCGDRFGLLTLGPAMAPLYREHVESLGLGSRLAAVDAPALERAFAPGGARVEPEVLDVLAAGAQRLRAAGAGAIVLAGAVLCGYAEAMRERIGMPALDGVACATRLARVRLALG